MAKHKLFHEKKLLNKLPINIKNANKIIWLKINNLSFNRYKITIHGTQRKL